MPTNQELTPYEITIPVLRVQAQFGEPGDDTGASALAEHLHEMGVLTRVVRAPAVGRPGWMRGSVTIAVNDLLGAAHELTKLGLA